MSVVTAGFMLGVSEFALRLRPHPHDNIVLHKLEDNLKKNHLESFAQSIVNDDEIFWRLAPDVRFPDDAPHIRGLVSNAAGLREDHEIPFEKPGGEVRVLFLGDSCTFGFGVLHHESIVECTERILNARFPGVHTECINAGVPGYTIMQGWRYFERAGLKYQPDIVISSFGWNDVRAWSTLSDVERYERFKKSTPPGCLARSEVCWSIWHLVAGYKKPPEQDHPIPRVSTGETAEILQRINAVAKTVGASFLPMVWPLLDNFTKGDPLWLNEYQKVTYRFGSEQLTFGSRREPAVIDLIPAIQEALKVHSLTNLFIDGVHTQARANEIIAEEITRKIAAWYEDHTHS